LFEKNVILTTSFVPFQPNFRNVTNVSYVTDVLHQRELTHASKSKRSMFFFSIRTLCYF